MQRLRRLIALLLLALWLPATLHCGLETAGVIEAFTCGTQDGHGCETTSACDTDGCKVVENGLYRSTTIVLNVSAAPLLCTCLLCLHPFEPDPVTASVLSLSGYSEPLELGHTWQFRERAAPPSRAPALVS